MKASHPCTIGAFEMRSVVLFASLVLGGAAGAQTLPLPAARSVPAMASSMPAAPARPRQGDEPRADDKLSAGALRRGARQ